MNDEQRMTRLAPHVKRQARTIAWRYHLPQDDVEQEMWVSILTHGDHYPEDRNLLVKAALDARGKLSRQRPARYLPVGMPTVSLDDSPPDQPLCDYEPNQTDTEASALRMAWVGETTPVRAEVRARVNGLRGRRRRVAELLMSEVKPSQIAVELGISRPAVSYHIRKLRAVFESYRYLCASV